MDYCSGVLVLLSLLGSFQLGWSGRYVRDVRYLMDKYESNRVMLNSIPKPYQIVFPKQIHRNQLVGISTKVHKIRHLGTHEHHKQVTFQLVLDGKKYKIKLERNEALLSAGIMVKHHMEQHQQVISKTVEHCYYHGYVKKDEWSRVAVSTCNGIRGVIQMKNETYVIQPFSGGDEGMEHPHVIFRASSSTKEKCGNSRGHWLPFHELHKGEFIRKLKYLRAIRMRREAFDNGEEFSPKLMRLAMVLDKSVCQGLNTSQSEMTRNAVEIANIVDMYFQELNIRVALTYLEFWNVSNQITVSPRQREMLEKFLMYKSTALQGVSFDVAYFITGIDLEDDSVGMAVPDAVCTDRAVGISRSPKPYEPQQAATILAHMIGHNLGIEHDEDGGCDCADEFGCIMSTAVLASHSYHSRMFSSCSKSDLNVSLSMEITSCLEGRPPTNFPQTCGNSIVERGEECDCGTEEECLRSDPCCDPHTCLLRYWAQCRSGPCCHNCTVLSKSHVCRPRSTECDVPEHCDGEHGECPSNNYVQDGHPCSNGTGYCQGGICPTIQQQCRDIWGSDADGGDVQCFQRFNPTGNFNGHCGKDEKTGNYAKCPADNVLCGLLHCEGGLKEPLYGPDKGFSKTTVNAHGSEYECKIIHGPAMMDMPHMGLTQDGTKCGTGKVCYKTKCLPIKDMPELRCPGTTAAIICSGHGVCTQKDTCFCDEGWSGLDCTVRVNLTSTSIRTSPGTVTTTSEKNPVAPVESRKEKSREEHVSEPSSTPVLTADLPGLSTKWLIIILASVVGGLVLVLSFTLLCYRRRSPSKLKKAKQKGFSGSIDSTEACKLEGALSAANRLITFGTLPSYKADKLFGKKKKKNKRMSSEDESDIGELPPPPTIISDPNSVMPEKGILKNSMIRLTSSDDNHRSSDSNTSNGDADGTVPYMYDEDEDVEAEEVREILGEDDFDPNQSLEHLNQLPESASFDFMVPPPPHFGMPSLQPSPPPPRRIARLDLPLATDPQHQPLLWRGAPSHHAFSPPRSRVVRLRNLDELLRQIDKHTIDLSPSPDEPPVQLSPSTCTSEDVRSSETDADRQGSQSAHTSHSDHSPTSVTSCSTQNTTRPIIGNLNQYMLKRGERAMPDEDSDMQSHPITIPPPMNPINIRNIFSIGQNGHTRDNADTPLGSAGENSSLNGTANSRNGYDKSSGYGSEHDPERFSIEDMSRSQSRSQSTSPPSYSAVIRTGPNQIKLVPAGKLQQKGVVRGSHEELHKLLEGLPRIDAGTFERSPIVNNPSYGLPNPRPLGDPAGDNENTPCIDRSLEEIPQDFSNDMKMAKKQHRRSLVRSKRPVSLGISSHTSPNSGETKECSSDAGTQS